MHPPLALEEHLRACRLKAGPLLVACSGGADSLALLLAAAEVAPKLGWRLRVLHCEHGLRGRASAGDAAFVAALCARLGLPLRIFRGRLKPGPGMEARARAWRRACYRRAAAEEGARLVLLGHHAADQAETLLLNLVRGSGEAGAAAMLAFSPLEGAPGLRLGRPFLGLEPGALKAWLRRRRQAWREDLSNRDLAPARNRLRHRVLPELARINPRAQAHLAAFAASLAAAKRPRDLAGLLKLDRGARARAAAVVAAGRGRADLGRGYSLQVSAGRARLLAPPPALELRLGSQAWGGWIFTLKPGRPGARSIKGEASYWFSPALLESGPRLRALKPGERLQPFGFTGRRKAADLLREAGVPAWEREAWPALEAGGGLLALPAVRRGKGFEAQAGKGALRLSWRPPA